MNRREMKSLQRPSGAQDRFWHLSQGCAPLALGYFLSAPPGRIVIEFIHFSRYALW
jgi:hypothetical protein